MLLQQCQQAGEMVGEVSKTLVRNARDEKNIKVIEER